MRAMPMGEEPESTHSSLLFGYMSCEDWARAYIPSLVLRMMATLIFICVPADIPR